MASVNIQINTSLKLDKLFLDNNNIQSTILLFIYNLIDDSRIIPSAFLFL